MGKHVLFYSSYQKFLEHYTSDIIDNYSNHFLTFYSLEPSSTSSSPHTLHNFS